MISRSRRLVSLGLCLLLSAFPVLAQQSGRVPRVGYMGVAVPVQARWLQSFRSGMAALGWHEKQDYVIDARFPAEGDMNLDSVAAQFAATPPDVMLLGGEVSLQPLAKKGFTAPVVFTTATDPVGLGLAKSLRRPGGNATGITMLSRDLSVKRLELLKEAFPKVSHVGVIYSENDPTSIGQVHEAEEAGKALKLRVSLLPVKEPSDIESVFKRGRMLGVHAYFVTQSNLFTTVAALLVEQAHQARVPTMFYTALLVQRGGLMSYAPSSMDNFRRAATYVDKILKGAKPGDLPIEQPSKLELVINMKTAKALGLGIPRGLLMRADEVIE